jgi:chromate transport protein ChrA
MLVAYLRVTFSALAAVIVALLGPTVMRAFQEVDSSRATGLAAFAGGALESFFTPLFWVLAFALFALFLGTSRFSNRPLRTVLFWLPVTTISTLGLGIFALFAYAWVHIRNR